MATNHLTELDKGIDLKLRVGCSQLKVGNVEYPSEDGNDGDVITTDGAGNVSWQPVSVPSSSVPTAKVGDIDGYLLITPATGVLFPISQNQSLIDWNLGFIATDSGLSITVPIEGIYMVTLNVEINVQTGLGGYFKIYNDNAIDQSSVVGATLDANGSSLNLVSLYRFSVGVNNVNIVGKYFGVLGETLGVANWNVTCHKIRDLPT